MYPLPILLFGCSLPLHAAVPDVLLGAVQCPSHHLQIDKSQYLLHGSERFPFPSELSVLCLSVLRRGL